MNGAMSTYDPESELSRFNAAPSGEWYAVSQPLFEVVNAAQTVSAQSGGAFDVTVGPLVNLWGFGPVPAGAAGTRCTGCRRGCRRPTADRLSESAGLASTLRPCTRTRPCTSTCRRSPRAMAWIGWSRCWLRMPARISSWTSGARCGCQGSSPRGTAWRIGVEQPRGGSIRWGPTDPRDHRGGGGHVRRLSEFRGDRQSTDSPTPSIPAAGAPIDHALASVTVVHAAAPCGQTPTPRRSTCSDLMRVMLCAAAQVWPPICWCIPRTASKRAILRACYAISHEES